MGGVAFSEAWRLYRASGMDSGLAWISIGYRKTDGSYGRKDKVRRAAGKSTNDADNIFKDRKDVKGIEKEVKQAGSMHFITPEGYRFEIKALGLMEINGRKIDHRF